MVPTTQSATNIVQQSRMLPIVRSNKNGRTNRYSYCHSARLTNTNTVTTCSSSPGNTRSIQLRSSFLELLRLSVTVRTQPLLDHRRFVAFIFIILSIITTSSQSNGFVTATTASRMNDDSTNNNNRTLTVNNRQRHFYINDELQQHFTSVFETSNTKKKQERNNKRRWDGRYLRTQLSIVWTYLFGNKTTTSTTSTISTTGNTDIPLLQQQHHIQSQQRHRHRNVEDANNNNNNNNNEEYDDAYEAPTDDVTAGYSSLCSKYLITFLEGTTDTRDTCEGIMNAYIAAECSTAQQQNQDYDYDDYFGELTEHQCCQALQSHHSDYCDEDNLLSNFHLFIAAAVLLLCECAKAFVTYVQIRFLPEAAVCILVGTTVGLAAHILPNTSIDDLSFDDDLFLSLLLPPIIFEAALSVSKTEFKRRRGAIFMFSVFGTIISTFSSGFMVHFASRMSSATTFPLLDSLVFGSLISSIDPVAILSVLTSLHMDQKDTIFILIFGESLLNDGIAITTFQTLVHRFDGQTNDGSTSLDEILDAVATFLIAMFGSIAVGLACGCGAWVFFNLLGSQLPPVMEVGCFFLWAVMPYYICDGVGWSGIVAIVAVGFFMDIYIAGPKHSNNSDEIGNSPLPSPLASPVSYSRRQQRRIERNRETYYEQQHMAQLQQQQSSASLHYVNMEESHEEDNDTQNQSIESLPTTHSISPLPSTERIHLSLTADKHVRFVAHLVSQLSENAIFAYLGLFLFSQNYDWNPTLITIAIVSCVLSRTFMVIAVSFLIFHVYRCRGISSTGTNSSRTAAAIREPRTQAVLVLAGLRGAVSLALVENVPIYNNVTGEGCEFKQTMKGMTSACILFTTFVFGGGAYYVLPYLGITRDENHSVSSSDETNNKINHNIVNPPPMTYVGRNKQQRILVTTPSSTTTAIHDAILS